MNYNLLFAILFVLQTALCFLLIYLHTKDVQATIEFIQLLKDENKAWADCCYVLGYTDGKNGKRPVLKSKEEILNDIRKGEYEEKTIN